MSKEKTNKMDVKTDFKKESNMQTNDINLIYNNLFESISPALESISLINKTLKSYKINDEHIARLNESMKDIANIGNQLSEIQQRLNQTIQPVIGLIANIKFPKININLDELKIHLYKIGFEEKKPLINKLYNKTVFPPILYIIENNIKEDSIENCEKWILDNKELKLFYINRIDKWKSKYSDENIERMIDEIKFNFEHNNSYSVCTLIFVLIEYMLNQNYPEKIKSNKYRYRSIKEVLKEKVFEPINIKKLYYKFIEENLYTSTDKAKEFSRHMTHGERIDFANMKSAMNMIFIYDFLQDVMIMSK